MPLTKIPAEMTAYTPSGTGAVATTVQGKLREIKSSTEYATFSDFLTAASSTGFWADGPTWGDPDSNPQFIRYSGRVAFGDAYEITGVRGTVAQTSWFPTAAAGPNWMPRDSDFTVMSQRGALAISGLSRTSDKAGLSPKPSTWGIGGFAIINSTGDFARGGYFEAQLDASAGVSGSAAGTEIVVKNKTLNFTSTPYNGYGSVMGEYMVAGGDPLYGGRALFPSNAAYYIARGGGAARRSISAISRTGNVVTATFSAALGLEAGDSVVVADVTDASFNGTFTLVSVATNRLSATWAQTAANASSSGGTCSFADDNVFRWNSGIVFDQNSLVGADGSGDVGQRSAVAMRMAAGHSIRWDNPAAPGALGASIRSDVNVSGSDVGIVFSNTNVNILGAGGQTIASFQNQTNAVNHVRLDNSTTGTPVFVYAAGSDTNVGIHIQSKGTSVVALASGNGTQQVRVSNTGIGFYGATTVAKPTVSGSRGGNAALASLMTALANLGLVTDSTTV